MVDRSLIAYGKRCEWMPPLILNLKVIFKDEKGQNWYFVFLVLIWTTINRSMQ